MSFRFERLYVLGGVNVGGMWVCVFGLQPIANCGLCELCVVFLECVFGGLAAFHCRMCGMLLG